jgi:hypothetical protein
MQKPKIKTQKLRSAVPDFIDIRFLGIFFELVISVGCFFGGSFSGWILGQVKLVVVSIFLFPRRSVLLGFKIDIFWCQSNSWHCAK